MKKVKVDPEFSSLITPLSDREMEELEQSLVKNGYQGPGIQLWNGVIVDGHNRYHLCMKHNIPFKTEDIEFKDREEAIEWMIRSQIARRNLTVAERIRLAERSRPAIEKAVRERRVESGKKYGRGIKKLPQNFAEAIQENKEQKETNAKLAKLVGINRETYRQGKRVLDSGDEELSARMTKGEVSINAAYKVVMEAERQKRNLLSTGFTKEDIQKEKRTPPKSQVAGVDDGSEAYQICIEAKTKRPTTSSGIRDIICRKLMDIVEDLESFVEVGLFDLYDFDGHETEESFASVGEAEDIEAVIENLNEITKISNEYIRRLKEGRDI